MGNDVAAEVSDNQYTHRPVRATDDMNTSIHCATQCARKVFRDQIRLKFLDNIINNETMS